MKREIKFRAWFDGKMYKHVEMTTYSDGGNCCTMIGDDMDSLISPDYDYITPMQYTGLTDEKGVEIYEGDIIAVYYSSGELWSIGEVEWGVYTMGINNGEYGQQIIGPYVKDEHLYDCLIAGSTLVIGNIYENPELLS